MGANTSIQWTATVLSDGTSLPGYTFNPWIGCARVSPGCAHCYAADLAKNRMRLDAWDDKAVKVRYVTSDSYWKQPFTWNRKAEQTGIRRKVFCASMADLFENRRDLDVPRGRVWDIINETPHLDWLLLTKRPQNVTEMVPDAWMGDGFPANVWMGTSVENQHWADIRIPVLLDIPAKIRFLSCEPLLGPVDLEEYLVCNAGVSAIRHTQRTNHACDVDGHDANCTVCAMEWHNRMSGISWVITGGESGPKHRPFKPGWARLLRDQCAAAGIPFFHKQNGGVTSKSGGDLLDGKQYHEWPVTATEGN